MSSPREVLLPNGMGKVYDYDLPGCTLEKHVHIEGEDHLIIVGRGTISLRVWSPEGVLEESEHEQGAVIDTFPHWPHEVIAKKSRTRTIHVTKPRV